MPVGYGGKNDAPTPRSSAGSSASRSVSSSTSRASGTGGGLGLTTGKTMYGNTAFGTAGGMAKGYATASGLGSGMGPSQKTYSSFKGLDGSAMFSGRAAQPVKASNATQAYGIAQQLASMFTGQPKPSSGAVGSGRPTPKAPYDATFASFKPWWNEPVDVGNIPLRPRLRPEGLGAPQGRKQFYDRVPQTVDGSGAWPTRKTSYDRVPGSSITVTDSIWKNGKF